MTNLLNYFLSTTPGPEMRFYIPLFALSLLLIIGGVIFSQIYKKKKKINIAFKTHFKSVSKIMVLLGIGFLFFTVVRYENIPYFSMRIWLYGMCLISLYTAFYYFKTYKTSYIKNKTIINYSSKKSEKKYSTAKRKR